MTHPFEKRRLRQISAYNVSTERDSEKIQLSRIRNRPVDGVRTSPLSPPKSGSEPIFQFFGIKFNLKRIKSATKFRCVKTSSGKVVEQSISYEITRDYSTTPTSEGESEEPGTSPLLPFPSPSLPLFSLSSPRSRLLKNPVGGPSERCKLSQWGLGWSPSRNRIWCILDLKSDVWWQQFQ